MHRMRQSPAISAEVLIVLQKCLSGMKGICCIDSSTPYICSWSSTCHSSDCTPYVIRPAHAVHFAVYEAAKKGLGETAAETSFAGAAAAGAAATVVSDACMTPFDVIKQRLQVGAATPYTW